MTIASVKYFARISVEAVSLILLSLSLFILFLAFVENVFPNGTGLSSFFDRNPIFSSFNNNPGRYLAADVNGNDIDYSSDTKMLAYITDRVRQVKTKRASGVAWNKAGKGMKLYEKDAVRTFSRSSANIRFTGNDNISMGENSLVIIRKNETDPLLQENNVRLLIVSGELRGKLGGSHADKVHLQVATSTGATAIATVRKNKKAEFNIKVNKDKSSTIAILKGEAKITAGDDSVWLSKNQAVTIFENQPIPEPQNLPEPIEALLPANKYVYYYRDLSPKIQFDWKTQSNVDEYRLVIAHDRGFKKIVADVTTSDSYFMHGNLKQGTYYWKVRGQNGRYNSDFNPPRQLRVVKDTTPPELKVSLPQKSVKQGRFVVSGSTEASASVFINSMPVAVDKKGRFSHEINFKKGGNVIVIEAVDSVGNTRVMSRLVNY